MVYIYFYFSAYKNGNMGVAIITSSLSGWLYVCIIAFLRLKIEMRGLR